MERKMLKPIAFVLAGVAGLLMMLFSTMVDSPTVSADSLTRQPETPERTPRLAEGAPFRPAILPETPIQRTLSSPDLTVQSLTLNPPNPAPGQPTTVTVVIKNVGTSSVTGGFYTYLYIDPPQQPPTSTTADTSYVGWFLGLNPNATFTWSYTDYVFTSTGCSHVVYAWVDRDNDVAEDNELNNLVNVNVCVGVSTGDGYEPDDNCAVATPITTNGTPQHHNFYPAGDQDWYQFNGIGGVEYLIAAQGVGANADPALSLFPSCASVPPSFGGGQQIQVTLPTSGTYYVKAVNHNISATTATSYTLLVSAGFNCSGYYEPNDTRATANDFVPGGAAQLHSFCAPGDEDWIKFTTQAGMTYTVRATGSGPDAMPLLLGFDPATAASSAITNPLQFMASANGTYYVRATNAISMAYGATTAYSLTVTVQTCVADTFEPDDSRAEASSIPVNGGIQAHVACPAGDRDWVRFTAAAGVTYTLETVGLGVKSDTVLCLYDNIGTEIACDDEGGVNHGSRLTWQATAPGEYFAEIRQATDEYAGAQTAYEFSVVTGLCRPDLYEPDDTVDTPSLSWLSTDGSRQPRNFCPAADRDWARLNIPAAGIYTLQTLALGPGSDTVLSLYDPQGSTLLSRSDDYGPGLASQIVYTFTQGGTYYVESHHFNPARYGRGTSYQLSAFAGTPSPTPPPGQEGTPTPTPTPTPPPPSGIQTLVVTNRDRLTATYGTMRADQLFEKLVAFVSRPAVQGEILQVENNPTVAAAYAAWIAEQTDVAKANQVTSAIRGVMMEYLTAHPSVQYIVLIGDDRVIPARRVQDRTSYPESQYTTIVMTTTVGAACANDYFLTDDYYADRESNIWAGAELYIPDWAIGRLVETPEQIGGMIDTFMASSELTAGKALVVGYDFVQDTATNICDLYGQDLGTANLDCTLISDSWNSDQFRQKQLNYNPPFKLQSINGHASHASQGAPIGASISAREVASGTSDLGGALIYSMGCHSGLNMPETSNQPLDLPEAFAWKRSNYVGNTGFGWGSRINVQFSERLMQLYTQELLKGSTTRIGRALVAAKQRYYQETDSFEERDEKVLQQSTLYGFPMYQLNTGAILGDENPFPSATISSTFPFVTQQSPNGQAIMPAALDQAGKGSLSINIGNASATASRFGAEAAGFTQVSTPWGNYFQLDGHINTQSDVPIQPQLYVRLVPPPGQWLRGVVFTGGSYYTSTINPVIDVATNEYVTTTSEPAFQSEGFYPPVPFSLQTNDVISRADTALTVVMGQYNSASNVQRLYNNLQYDVYFSALSDEVGPTIPSVDGYYNTRTAQATFKVEANDALTVTRVLVAYTVGAGSWSSHDLSYNPATHKWSGLVPGIRGASYYVQAVDSAGNATAVSRKGGYFALESVDLPVEQWFIYLPLVIRQGGVVLYLTN